VITFQQINAKTKRETLKEKALTARGVPRLDGARGKKQDWRPHVST